MQLSSHRRLTSPVSQGWIVVAGALFLLLGCDSASRDSHENPPKQTSVAAGSGSSSHATPADEQVAATPGESIEAVPAGSGETESSSAGAGDSEQKIVTTGHQSADQQAAARSATVAKTSAEKTSATGNPDRIVDKTFDDLKFDIEPDAPFKREMLTEEIEALFGQRIRIRGYIYPTPQREGITQFILVRDDQECCFGPGAALFDCIIVEMQPGKSAKFSVKPVAVEGRFTFQELMGFDNKPMAIFHLEGESVK
jgi:hypothetical protein